VDYFREKFDCVIEIGRPNSKMAFPWPTKWPGDYEKNFARPKVSAATLIASNRVSFFDGELYSFRRKVIHSLPSLPVFGRDWNIGTFQKLPRLALEFMSAACRLQPPRPKHGALYLKSARRKIESIEDKFNTNSQFKVSVVIENSDEYVSEKILEAILSGSIPVYVGSDPSVFGLPNELFVACSPNLEELSRGIEKALQMDFEVWAAKALDWLQNSREAKLWRVEFFWESLENLMQERMAEL
jgi:hypothetical protein